MNKSLSKIIRLKKSRLKIKETNTEDRKRIIKRILLSIIDLTKSLVIEGDAIIYIPNRHSAELGEPSKGQIEYFLSRRIRKKTKFLISVITKYKIKDKRVMFHLPQYCFENIIPILNIQKFFYKNNSLDISQFC